jgi:hypothetical protein
MDKIQQIHNSRIMPPKNKNTVDWYVEDALDTLWVHVKEAIREDEWVLVVAEEQAEGK